MSEPHSTAADPDLSREEDKWNGRVITMLDDTQELIVTLAPVEGTVEDGPRRRLVLSYHEARTLVTLLLRNGF